MVFFVLVINHMTDSATGIFYALIISVLLPWLFPVAISLVVLAAYNLLIGIQFGYIGAELNNPTFQYVLFFVYLGVSVFSFIISLVAFKQQHDKEQLRLLNTELKATQVLLADSSRISERLRISRELHDLVGHHLTALTLNLEAASHLTEGKPQRYVKKSQSIARLLLADVREVVGQFRQSGTLNLGQAINELLSDLPGLKVNKDIPENLLVEDPRLAQTILRCTQELITNVLKHAKAHQLWVKLSSQEDQLLLTVKDDGRGLGNKEFGNGLTGIQERVAIMNGTFEISDQQGACVRLTFPI
ncbi:sensor histidine kinase [Marinicella gelatinilytica]|uniref:sensor histidine kinase n=1 Tax=Marinicella gelatinilytica TaxID=2996017 RepID=UPI002260A131|nr:sensor histidine kinase [Marinicella gelatinilytica]MCX7544651.1 sensor histidine kinase [Marinicella gelatinilytica]